ncbi:glycosylphophatidylinositol anchor phosphoethanolamine transferase [Echria macrotheca]|uniref:Glycosylphophatidylinositol anchor phosphoethanolamine transferase n=1 Tax=Echria macrotheca TaxID=438768 RepID=A0AAJ0F8L1_9PEZI|nr:glycosylphophatidylinositol anchor phosphoethanolamine transferase [Echria macrotheca]
MPLIDPVTMSSSLTKGGAQLPTAKGKDAPSSEPTIQPIQIKPTPVAQAARHVFPLLLASLFALQFRPLVADPVSTMLTSLPVVALLQLAYVLVCLPAAGSQGGGASTASGKQKTGRKVRPGEKKKGMGGGAAAELVGPNAPVASILSLVLSVLAIPPLYIAFVCFGAPLYTLVAHTGLCAAHLAVLSLFPLFYVHGVDGGAWRAVGAFQAPFDEVFGGFVGAFVGAWLGAVPIPLDWDRDWQRWPVTILCGLYGGCLLGRVLGGSLFWGKRVA